MFAQTVPGFTGPGMEDRVRAVRPDAEEIALVDFHAVKDATPVYCTSDYTTMLTTMASAAPKSALAVPDITSPTGLLVFEETTVLNLGPRNAPIGGVRAYSWCIIPSDDPTNTSLMLRVWTDEKRGPSTPVIPSRFKLYPGPLAMLNINPATAWTADDHVYARILQSHFALMKSPLTLEDPVVRDPKTSPRTKRSLGDTLRRVYLRHPEYAGYEADEAAAAREGRAPMRAHWVRGHWRNQHYSTFNENRWIWIDGYIKGNPENGTVTTRKICVARASTSEVRELAGAS